MIKTWATDGGSIGAAGDRRNSETLSGGGDACETCNPGTKFNREPFKSKFKIPRPGWGRPPSEAPVPGTGAARPGTGSGPAPGRARAPRRDRLTQGSPGL
eukprot:763795-Hanusia_phi.AAC.1